MEWSTETFAPRVDIALKAGYATETTCLVLVASLSNADANLNVNGVDYAITGATEWVELGSDISAIPQATWETFPELGPYPVRAGYIYSFTVTGLSPLTKYPWTLTQTGSDTNTGTFMSKPSSTGTDPFSLWFVSCDAGATTASSIGWANGGYQTISEYIKADVFPLVSVMHLDDYGYLSAQPDTTLNDYAGGDADRSGLAQYDKYSNYAIGSGGEYMGAVAWFNYLNLTGYKNTVPTNWGDIAITGDSAIRSFSGDHREYVMQNSNFCYCPGDWEYKNDIGWDTDAQVAELQAYQTGRSIQELFVEPLQPPHIVQNAGTDRGINPLNYDVTYGPVQIISPDGVVNGTGAMDVGTTEDYTDPVKEFGVGEMVYGPKQINDVLTAFDNTTPFKILMLMYGVRYPILPFGSEFSMGSQHPLADHIPLEYEPWFTEIGNTPKSIMDNPNTNGTTGKLLCMHGDTHVGMRHQHRKAKSGLLNELFDSLYVGTVNVSGQHGVTNLVEGGGHDGTTLTNLFTPSREWSSVRLDVRVDLDPIELHYYFYTEDSVTEAAAVFKQTADQTDSALQRFDDMSKTFRDAYTPDVARSLKGDEIVGATKQDAGDEDTGFVTNEMALFNDLRYIRAAEAITSLSASFSPKKIQTPLDWYSDQNASVMTLATGGYTPKGDGSISALAGSTASTISSNIRVTSGVSNTLMIVVMTLGGGSGFFSIGGDYYFYANGFYFSLNANCGITKVKLDGAGGTDAYVRFAATAAPDVTNKTIALALYYDPADQTNCRRFEVAVRSSLQEFTNSSPNVFGNTAMSGSFTITDDFDPPTPSTPVFGFYKLDTSSDLTTAGNVTIMEAGLKWMQANPTLGIASDFSVFT